jgi:hypothetical protein
MAIDVARQRKSIPRQQTIADLVAVFALESNPSIARPARQSRARGSPGAHGEIRLTRYRPQDGYAGSFPAIAGLSLRFATAIITS